MSGQPSGRRRLGHILAAALAVAALAAPTAGARPYDEYYSGSKADSAAAPAQQAEAPAPTVTRSVEEGFDWGSAAIGAGCASAVLLLAGAATASHRHERIGVVR